MSFKTKTTKCKCGNHYTAYYSERHKRFIYLNGIPVLTKNKIEAIPKNISKCNACSAPCVLCGSYVHHKDICFRVNRELGTVLVCPPCNEITTDCLVCGTLVQKKAINKLAHGFTCDYHSPSRCMANAFLDYGVKFPIVSIKQDKNGELIGAELADPPQWCYGMEIEMEYEGRNRPNVSSILHDVRPTFPEIPAPFFIAKGDGSLDSSGVEWVFQPVPYSYVLTDGFKKIFSRISQNVTSTGRCGLHISMGREHLSDEKIINMQRFFRKYHDKFIRITRRNPGNYCYIGSDCGSIWSDHGSWVSSTQKRIEFRGFAGITTLEQVQQAMNLVDAWRKFFRSHNKYTWTGFSKFMRKNADRFENIIGLLPLAEEKMEVKSICA